MSDYMFNKERFSILLQKSLGERTETEYSNQSGVNRTYISKFLNKRIENPPSPYLLKKLADFSHNNVTYMQFMASCGYVKYDNNITEDKNIRTLMTWI